MTHGFAKIQVNNKNTNVRFGRWGCERYQKFVYKNQRIIYPGN